jgi:N utilization substance protein A
MVQEIDLKTLSQAVIQIAEERGIPKDKIIEVIETALGSAYKKEYGQKEEKYKARFNQETGKADFFLVKKVVDDDMILKEGEEQDLEGEVKKVRFNPLRHIKLEEAKKIKKDVKAGDELEFPLPPPKRFGRIAAQTAKQVLLQKIREAEKEVILQEFSQKKGEVVSGVIQRKEGDKVFVDIGKTIAVLEKEDQIPGEFYKIGTRMRFYCQDVKETPRGPEVKISRSHPKFLSQLFKIEVPEISSGIVEIKSIARDPGSRSKVAVFTKEPGIDPVGSCVGQRGTRVNAVMQELGREKIDIIAWDENPENFIKNALSPAEVLEVKIKKDKAEIKVPEDQVSLAIGRDGQNVRLASELTGWKIEVKGVEVSKEAEELENEEVKEKTREEAKEGKEQKESSEEEKTNVSRETKEKEVQK